MASSTVVTKNGEAFWNKMPGARHRANLNSMYDAWLLALEEAVGPQGWSPVFGVTTNGDRRVLQIVDWVGGAGAKPSITGYIGPSGIVPTAGAAVDIRGTQGLKGDQGDKGNTGNHGWSPQIRTTIDGERVVQELYDWTGGQGSKPATGYIGVSGLVSNIADASNIRGGKGDTGDTGPANELTIGTVESGATPSVTITGESPQQVLNFVLEKGDTGNTAWTPVYTAVADGERSILRIDDWTGGQGTKPATGYLGPLGVVANVGDALDIRGAPGSGSVSSVNEIDPDGSGNVALGIADIPGLEDALDNAGQVKTVAGKGPDGSGNVALVKGDVGLDNVDNTSDANKPVSSATLAALGNKIDAAEKGAALGVAPLDASGHVPAINLPSYVDDVLEYANFGALPGAGETGKIYVTLNDNKTWRWGGSAYVEISASPGSTDAVPEGSSNLYFTVARVRATVLTGLSLASSAAITASDTVLSAFGKLQKQITDLVSSLKPVATTGSYNDLDDKPSIPSDPGGGFAGVTATQTLTNKTLGAETKESVLDSGTAITINDAAVPWRHTTLTANRTATISLSVGVSRSIWINPSTYTVTWPANTVWKDGSAPELPASKWSLITITGRPGNTAGFAALIWSEE